jgi:hypothetical protein
MRFMKRWLDVVFRGGSQAGSPLETTWGAVVVALLFSLVLIAALRITLWRVVYQDKVLPGVEAVRVLGAAGVEAGAVDAGEFARRFPQLSGAFERQEDRIQSRILRALAEPLPLAITELGRIRHRSADGLDVSRAPAAARLDTNVTKVAGSFGLVSYSTDSAAGLAHDMLPSTSGDAELDRLLMNTVGESIEFARKSVRDIRLIQLFSGPIQNLILFAALFTVGMLVLRLGWIEVQRDSLRTGRTPGDEETWDFSRARTETRMRESGPADRGRYVGMRILVDAVLAKYESPDKPVREIIREFVAKYAHASEDEDYELIDFLQWLLPTLGFLGTVLGIIGAMSAAPEIVLNIDPSRQADAIREVSRSLATAFDTTGLGLGLAVPVAALVGIARTHEKRLFAELEDSAMRVFPAELEVVAMGEASK